MRNCILSFIAILAFSCQPEKIDHLNFIVILADDMGYADLSCYDSALNETPNLDKLASEGFRSTGFYAAQAVCSASRAAILTGCYPNRIGIHNAFMPDAKKGLHKSETTIAELVKQKDYSTGIIGKWHLGDNEEFLPLNHGFDEFYGIPYSNDMWPFHPQQGSVFNFGPLPLIEGFDVIDTIEDQSTLTTKITEKALDFIDRNQKNPFFLYVPHPQPHVPLFVSDKFKGKSKNGLYGDVMMEIDWSVGQIVEKLKNLNLDKNTVIIFTSDNGPWLAYGNHAGSSGHLREGKGTAWEGGQREPFIVWAPGLINGGIVSSTPIYAIDLLPTIAHLGEFKLPDLKIDGLNAWPIISDISEESPHEAFYYYYRVNELHAIRYKDWKMVFPHRYRSMQGQEPGKDGLPGNYTYFNVNSAELYNLKSDPEEQFNVYKENLNIVATIERLAEKARQDLGDSLHERVGKNSRNPGRIK